MLGNGKQRGFTLVELMIVIAVIGLLASVGIPSFLEQMRKGWRAEGKSALMAAVQMEERFRTMNNTYTTVLANAGIRNVSCDSANCRYAIAVAAGPNGIAVDFTVRATPQGWADSRCGDLTLTSTGVRGVTGPASVDQCWR